MHKTQTQRLAGLAASYLMVLASLSSGLAVLAPTAVRAGVPNTFDPNNLIDPASFISTDTMSVNDIQNFLATNGSGLATYSENGRSAAQIIWDASHGHGDASGSVNSIQIDTTTGTVNPRVLLVTLQKEQSLITLANPSQAALNYAMGYGCPDSGGCNSAYQGFTKQVENAAWQLRYNYEAAGEDNAWRTTYYSSKTAPYYTDETVTMTDGLLSGTQVTNVTFANQATASLYRYTPHVYNGNYNFWKFYHQWFATWQGQVTLQSADPTVAVGQAAFFEVKVKNMGDATWEKGAVNLGTAKNFDRIPAFTRGDGAAGPLLGWISPNRVAFQEATVPPGASATFAFYSTVPQTMAPGSYTEAFDVVSEGITWFDGLDIVWHVTVTSLADAYQARLVNQSGNPTIVAGDSAGFEASFLNTGSIAWQQGEFNLGTDQPQDRTPAFIREDQTNHNPSGWVAPNRVQLLQATVPPGSVGTFRFYYTVPASTPAGVYHESFRPVVDGIKWLDGAGLAASWDVTVRSLPDGIYSTQWLSQTPPVTLKPGQSHQFTVTFTNTSATTWRQDVVHLGTDQPEDRIPQFIRDDLVGHNPSGWVAPNRVKMEETSVPPGGTATFTFWYTVPPDMPAGTYQEYFRPVADGIIWMRDWGVYWDITVTH